MATKWVWTPKGMERYRVHPLHAIAGLVGGVFVTAEDYDKLEKELIALQIWKDEHKGW